MSLELSNYMGYGKTPNPILMTFETDNVELASVVEEILVELREIDTALKAARSDSMASEVSGIKVDYERHIVHLKTEGSRLLRQLESLTEEPVKHNKYGDRPVTTTTDTTTRTRTSAYNVTSYW